VPVARCRTPAARQNSCVIVIVTNAHNAKHSPDDQKAMPSAPTPTPSPRPADVGHRNW
jgi:hypothetical protein